MWTDSKSDSNIYKCFRILDQPIIFYSFLISLIYSLSVSLSQFTHSMYVVEKKSKLQHLMRKLFMRLNPFMKLAMKIGHVFFYTSYLPMRNSKFYLKTQNEVITFFFRFELFPQHTVNSYYSPCET